MKRMTTSWIFTATVTLASCGGGGSATGGLSEFSLVPDAVEWSAAKGDTACQFVGGAETLVTVIGGTPPYRLVNSFPQAITISDTKLTEKNPTFKMVLIGGCGKDMSILVLDNKSRSVTFKVTVTAGEEVTTTAP